jgi:23S rRNA pseudouridine1911/1915/1917 synthase
MAGLFEVIHSDDQLVVVDKGPGLVVHPAPGYSGPTLTALVEDLAGGEDPERPGVVHRIDRDTSGLLVLARTPEAHASLAAQIQAREVKRRYLALVAGHPRSRTGTIDAPLGRDHRARERVVIGGRGARAAVTHFEVLERIADDATLLSVRLETGRTHQIRVHLASIGLPIAGDPDYGRPGLFGLERQFLHAAELAFIHPGTGERVSFESPLPPDLAKALETARKAPNA